MVGFDAIELVSLPPLVLGRSLVVLWMCTQMRIARAFVELGRLFPLRAGISTLSLA